MTEQPRSLGEGRYQVLEKIGEGGFAIVYLVFDNRLKRNAAVKMLRPALAIRPRIVARFGNERAVASRFSHPKSVVVYDVGEEDGALYEVMEYVEGGCVDEAMQRQGAIPPRAACRIILDVLKFLEAFHNDPRGFIHRDIKPGNILLTKDGEVKVTDFGITVATAYERPQDAPPKAEGSPGTMIAEDDLGSPGVTGTLGFMSLEQQTGNKVGVKADLFSVGVTLWAMLTNPTSNSNEWYMWLVRSTDHPHLIGVPEPLRSVIVGAVRGTPEERVYKSAREMAVDLAKAAQALEPDQSDAFFDRLAKGEVRNQTIVVPDDRSLEELQSALHGRTSATPEFPSSRAVSPVTGADWSEVSAERPIRSRRWVPIGLAAAAVLFLTIGGFMIGGNSDPAPVQEEVVEPEVSLLESEEVSPAPTQTVQTAVVTPAPAPAIQPTKAIKPKSSQTAVASSKPRQDPKPVPLGKVTVKNAPQAIRLVGGPGTFPIPGDVPPGEYTIEAKFEGTDRYASFGQIAVADGATLRVSCDPDFKSCR